MAAVDAAIAPAHQARAIARHEEQRNAVLAVHRARGAGADQQQLRVVALHHHGLLAREQPALAIAHGAGFDARERVVRAWLVVRQRGDGAAVDQAGDTFLLRGGARSAQRPAHHQRAQEGLDHQAPAQGFKDDRNIKTGAAKAAVAFREQRANGAQLGKLRPQRGVHAAVAVGDVVAGFNAVLLGHKTVQGVRQHAAVFGVFKVHRVSFRGPESFLK